MILITNCGYESFAEYDLVIPNEYSTNIRMKKFEVGLTL